ncbi:DUF721 domain-containing protein [Bartonella henselae]|uniref:DUF721 domain-containing protein n=1 Tax=Bartonella henselae (strain ATCC 49882 / DSM 28221 / CCUG 30454 / Houston 1) TaxID=283166 RepID=A0A0H3LXS5_BARHE|nr:DciA family protein [Bartonella henselae]ATP12066.1 hypothetical protein BhenCHDE101_02365 [Bartonella henselae]ETS07849.1 hypothetical protein Q653_00941 [Bartonella henselae JK 42]MDM9983996.1 DciA family protein [Bartonella henselae]MDM9985514.1 DciA family protein [Bartonella henselae]MDM9987031.1 DciA family protein [Bartonella henselae]
MSKQFQKRHFYSLSEIIFKMLDPILRKRTGLNVALIENWSQIAGRDIAEHTVPLKIIWKRRVDQDEIFQPGTLIVACEGFVALKLIHETAELIHRINVFFGYIALNRIKIEQRSVSVFSNQLPRKLSLSVKEKKCVEKMLEGVENESLRQSLYELGCCIFAEKKNK